MRTSWLPAALLLVLAWPAGSSAADRPASLAVGQALTLRVLQVQPFDGLSPGERLLNGLADILPGDRFVAEVIDPPCPQPLLVGGKVTNVVKPGWFGRPGHVAVQFVQLAQEDGTPLSWPVDLADRRRSARVGRALIAALLAFDGLQAGASVGTALSRGHPAWVMGGMGVGLVVGLAYASLQRGVEARLEPGDTFQIVVGTCQYRPIPADWQTILYPAPPPDSNKHRGK
jgi:hypothetical protein